MKHQCTSLRSLPTALGSSPWQQLKRISEWQESQGQGANRQGWWLNHEATGARSTGTGDFQSSWVAPHQRARSDRRSDAACVSCLLPRVVPPDCISCQHLHFQQGPRATHRKPTAIQKQIRPIIAQWRSMKPLAPASSRLRVNITLGQCTNIRRCIRG